LIYLAIPYTGQREFSYEVVNKVAGELMLRGHVVFSPISHSHAIAEASDLTQAWEFWEKQDQAFINLADEVLVVCIDGWDHSRGVIAELEMAKARDLKIGFLDCKELEPDQFEFIDRGAKDFEPIVIEVD
jgi:hypothetical protein